MPSTSALPASNHRRQDGLCVTLTFIQPGKPDQNAFIERFNKTYREEVLDAYVFESVEQVREVTETWLHEYNEERPHDSLGRVPPLTFMPRPLTARESSFKLMEWSLPSSEGQPVTHAVLAPVEAPRVDRCHSRSRPDP